MRCEIITVSCCSQKIGPVFSGFFFHDDRLPILLDGKKDTSFDGKTAQCKCRGSRNDLVFLRVEHILRGVLQIEYHSHADPKIITGACKRIFVGVLLNHDLFLRGDPGPLEEGEGIVRMKLVVFIELTADLNAAVIAIIFCIFCKSTVFYMINHLFIIIIPNHIQYDVSHLAAFGYL